jgi:hypothetical protein
MFQGFGNGSPSFVAKQTHPGWDTWVTRKGSSQPEESFLAPSRVSTCRSTRSSTWSSLLRTNADGSVGVPGGTMHF